MYLIEKRHILWRQKALTHVCYHTNIELKWPTVTIYVQISFKLGRAI